jgi:hypothetical protein
MLHLPDIFQRPAVLLLLLLLLLLHGRPNFGGA